jgi:SAM-dependent methyltransferase
MLRRLLFDKSGRWTALYYLLLAGPRQVLTRRFVRRRARSAGLVLDVGSRKSPYTRNLNSRIICMDKPTHTDGYLGFTDKFTHQLSGVENYFVVYGDAECLPFRNGSVDLVLCFEVIEHVSDPKAAIAALARVMAPSGRLLLTTPNGLVVPCENPYHQGHLTRASLAVMLSKHFHQVVLSTWCPFRDRADRLHMLWLRYQSSRGVGCLVRYMLARLKYLILIARHRNVEGTVLVAEAYDPIGLPDVEQTAG